MVLIVLHDTCSFGYHTAHPARCSGIRNVSKTNVRMEITTKAQSTTFSIFIGTGEMRRDDDIFEISVSHLRHPDFSDVGNLRISSYAWKSTLKRCSRQGFRTNRYFDVSPRSLCFDYFFVFSFWQHRTRRDTRKNRPIKAISRADSNDIFTKNTTSIICFYILHNFLTILSVSLKNAWDVEHPTNLNNLDNVYWCVHVSKNITYLKPLTNVYLYITLQYCINTDEIILCDCKVF